MSRRRKPARLLYRASRDRWIIRDGEREIWTSARGRGGGHAAEAELARYLAAREPENVAPGRAGEVGIGEVLTAYAREIGPGIVGRQTLGYAIKALAAWWGDLTCDAVRGETCRRYGRERGVAPNTVRRDLGVLQAALNHAHREGRLLDRISVTLPPADAPKDRWLTRAEIRAVMRHAAPHLRRFIVLSVLTGTRPSAVLGLRWTPSLDSGWIDLDRGVLHRRGPRERETKKRRGSVRMPEPLVRLARRWDRGEWVIEHRGQRVANIRRAWDRACERAGVEGATPHTLKHTAVTWAFQRGITREDAADYFDTEARTLERVYRSHSPDHQSRAASIMGRRR